ncbi:MAG: tetratricopeptide repeat protein, partial [Proteobacteria bacterium]|nr:tetratricopeptide repeat protein [Pseudomonadota bacterium]
MAAADSVGATDRERRHIDALRAWSARDIVGATSIWEEILLSWPRDIVALRLAHFTHFYLGDSPNLRDSIGRVLHAWDETSPGYPYLLGMWAFGLEENGDFVRAESAGRKAVELNPGNIWAVHAVAHVMEMQGRTQDGIAWLTATEPAWADCNNFTYHVWWHRALFHLERGEHDAVLAHYDSKFRADVESEDYLDMSNAVAMLWRLENEGVDIGQRWLELGEKAEKRIDDHIFVFIDAHLAMALAA